MKEFESLHYWGDISIVVSDISKPTIIEEKAYQTVRNGLGFKAKLLIPRNSYRFRVSKSSEIIISPDREGIWLVYIVWGDADSFDSVTIVPPEYVPDILTRANEFIKELLPDYY